MNTDSALWRNLLKNKTSILDTMTWVIAIGDGSHISTLQDKWVPGLTYLSDIPMRPGTQQANIPITLVKDLVKLYPSSNQLEWDIEQMGQIRDRDAVQSILAIPLGGLKIPCWNL